MPSCTIYVFARLSVCLCICVCLCYIYIYICPEAIIYCVCFTVFVYEIYIHHAGVSLRSLGPDVQNRAKTDRANYYVMNTEFNFSEDGRIMGWILWAENAGQARLQVNMMP